MQFVGIGLPELLLILVLTVIVVGPERLPEAAAQLARWIRQVRAYAQFVAKDFNEVMGELEKEVGTSREDLREIASVLRRDTTAVFDEIDKAGKEIRDAADIEKAAGTSTIPLIGGPASNGQAANGGAFDSTAEKEAAMAEDSAGRETGFTADGEATAPQPADQEWYVPSRSPRRRPGGDETP